MKKKVLSEILFVFENGSESPIYIFASQELLSLSTEYAKSGVKRSNSRVSETNSGN